MAGAAGPNTAETGLVFAYDTGNTSTCFYGEPTTNLVLDPDGNANIITTDVPFGTGVIGYAQYSSGYYVNPRSTTPTSATGNTFTYSVYMRSQTSPSSTYLMYVYTGTGPDGGWYYFGDGALTSDWKKYTYSRNDMTGTVSTVTVYRYNQQGTIDIAAPQIELKTHATQFTKGTRSATQGMIPFISNSTLDLDLVSFDTNAQMVFDGTNDYLDTGKTAAQLGMYDASYTAECFCYPTVLSSDKNMFGTDQTAYRQGLHLTFRSGAIYMGHYSSDFSAGTVTINNWYHIVFRYNAATSMASIFKNGVLQGSGGIASFIGTTNILISREFGGYNFAGYIPIAKIYNRPLTDLEVAQNFQASRYRFGI